MMGVLELKMPPIRVISRRCNWPAQFGKSPTWCFRPRLVRRSTRRMFGPCSGPIAASVNYLGSFHSLRHFVASVAVASVPLALVSKVLGHRRSALTADLYSHLLASEAGQVSLAVSLAVKSGRAK